MAFSTGDRDEGQLPSNDLRGPRTGSKRPRMSVATASILDEKEAEPSSTAPIARLGAASKAATPHRVFTPRTSATIDSLSHFSAIKPARSGHRPWSPLVCTSVFCPFLFSSLLFSSLLFLPSFPFFSFFSSFPFFSYFLPFLLLLFSPALRRTRFFPRELTNIRFSLLLACIRFS